MSHHPAPTGLPNKSMPPKNLPEYLVAIGASTGGPAALLALLSELPADFPAAIVVVQHIDEKHAFDMAQWLDKQVSLNVRSMSNGESPEAGTVWLSRTNNHIRLNKDGKLIYTPRPRDLPWRPSVDEFLCSVALHWRSKLIAALLTGMGWDGARGLLALRRLGHHTFAQDENSCAIYGMPRGAVNRGAAREILSPGKIGKRLCDLTLQAPIPNALPTARNP